MKTAEAVLDLVKINAYLLDTVRTLATSLKQAAEFMPTPEAREATARMGETGLAVADLEASLLDDMR